jgi:hypothetical protein
MSNAGFLVGSLSYSIELTRCSSRTNTSGGTFVFERNHIRTPTSISLRSEAYVQSPAASPCGHLREEIARVHDGLPASILNSTRHSLMLKHIIA